MSKGLDPKPLKIVSFSVSSSPTSLKAYLVMFPLKDAENRFPFRALSKLEAMYSQIPLVDAVSYTHLTLPTILLV